MNETRQEAVAVAVFRGTRREQIVANHAWEQLFASGVPQVLREKIEASAVGQEGAELHLTCRTVEHLDGRAIRIFVEPIGDTEIMATCIDQTELYRARVETARATELKERVLAAVSHDVKGTLSTILLWERVLRERYDDSELRGRALEAIRQTATAQSDAVSELQHVANPTTPLEYERLALESILTTAIELQAAIARQHVVQLVSDYRPPLGYVRADRARLRRAFETLLETRIRSTPSGESCTVAARRLRDELLIIIGNVDPAEDDESVASLDLPLVVVGELLAHHGGTLDMTRPSHGGAPTFRISLPLAARTRA
jgi:signal transduction histidine kinase